MVKPFSSSRAGWATRLASQMLYRVIAILLLCIAVVLVLGHNTEPASGALLAGPPQMVADVAGGELLIPTLVLLFGIDIKLAGSLSLSVSLPTMLVCARRQIQFLSLQYVKLAPVQKILSLACNN